MQLKQPGDQIHHVDVTIRKHITHSNVFGGWMWQILEHLPYRVAATYQQLEREIIQGWMCGWDKKQVGD